MQNSKALGLIQCLDAAEREQFDAFLRSPLLPENERLIRLYEALQTAVQTGDEPDRKKLFRTCFGKQPFDDKKLRYLLTELCTRLQEFIKICGLKRQDAAAADILARELARRGAHKAYNALVQEHRKKEIQETQQDADFYFHSYEQEFIHLAHAPANVKRDEKSNIETVVNNLDRFYLARKLQLCCEIFNVRNVLAVDYNVFLLDEIRHHLRNNSYEDVPVIRIYYNILMTLLESENEQHFVHLRELLLQHGNRFSLAELREMYQYVLNYCIKKINTGNISYQKTLLDIFKVTLENKVLLSEGHLSQWDYKNIVTISLRQQEFDWAHAFIQRHRSFIKLPERENAYIYNLAFWHFHKGEYSQTLQLLQQVEFTDLYYQLDSRVIILKIYFEQDDTETFFYHSSAFRIFLRRNKLVSDYQRTIYLNLVRFTHKLFRAGTSRRKIQAVKKSVDENRQVADLAWLLKKIEERE